ncbi:hypothetical protein F511_14272 [Dorcoceras hygrometricum]|uniref:Uncharacterized protein n=1 Tax=Dorcoceras hygrometricum TaxID=472368 RepID=A0A2Z7BPG8_9LAMI|nr:hypothetical protein F511_14272 [Dorcoceras hygrometricum]
MNGYDQNQIPASYPSTATKNNAYVMAPPPIGYPTKDDRKEERVPVETKNRGDGFLKGW